MKKILSLMMVLMMMVLLLAGCNNASGGVTTAPATQPSKPVATMPVVTTPAPTAPTTTPVPTTPPTTPAPTEPTTAEPEDPLALFRTTFEIAAKDQGVFLVRDDKIYTLNQYILNKAPGVDYSAARYNMVAGSEAQFYMLGRDSISGYSSSMGGNIPIPILAESDKVIAFSQKIYDLKLASANLVGYSPALFDLTDYYVGFDRNGTKFSFESRNATNVTITDAMGGIVEDYSSFKKDELYTFSWYEGTKYHEIELIADCFTFDYDTAIFGAERIVIPATLTKNGYVEYDMSGVPSGLYLVIDGGCLIQIP